MKIERFNEIFDSIDFSPRNIVRNKYHTLVALWNRILDGDTVAMRRMIKYCAYRIKQIDIVPEMFSKHVLCNKANEYALEGDRLWNFKETYGEHITPSESLIGYMRKHYRSVMDIETDKIKVSYELIKEKYGDLLNYCILLIAITEEKSDEILHSW